MEKKPNRQEELAVIRKRLAAVYIVSLLLVPSSPPLANDIILDGIDYILRMETSYQSNSNPGLASEVHDNVESSNVMVNSIGMALRIPLLSDDTRLDIAGVGGDARYSGQHQFNHQPRRLDTKFHWRATDLFDGNLGYESERRRYESDRIWPDSDTVDTRRLSARLGVNLSDSLTLPIVNVFEEKSGYQSEQNRQLFDSTEKGWEVAGKYQSLTGSSVAIGLVNSETHYPLRHQLNRSDLDDAYSDRELFAETYWQYSVKTGLYTRLGWLSREYETISGRDTNLLHLDTQAIWQYSPKTELRLGLWQRPFNNDEDPNITYSSLRGFGLSAGWQPSPKLALSLYGSYELQDDTQTSGEKVNSTRTRLGPRLAWKAHPNISVIVDGYQTRKSGDIPSNNYKQAVVRLGVVVQTDSGNIELAELLNPRQCRWSHVETSLCPR